MAVTYKDIDLLTQKASVAGTEKLPVSDTEYITPLQIVEAIADGTETTTVVETGTLATKAYVDDLVGDIESLLAAI